jgi:anti-sigma regulatory factor (Ser/Thr protein kinase)
MDISASNARILDLEFDDGMLGMLRAVVKARARQAGLIEARAEDVVLAVHELAANAVYHGAGAARLRMWKTAGALLCQVADGDIPADAASDSSPESASISLPYRPGHGLWVVRQIASWIRVRSGSGGTRATVSFDLLSGGSGGLQLVTGEA